MGYIDIYLEEKCFQLFKKFIGKIYGVGFDVLVGEAGLVGGGGRAIRK